MRVSAGREHAVSKPGNFNRMSIRRIHFLNSQLRNIKGGIIVVTGLISTKARSSTTYPSSLMLLTYNWGGVLQVRAEPLT